MKIKVVAMILVFVLSLGTLVGCGSSSNSNSDSSSTSSSDGAKNEGGEEQEEIVITMMRSGAVSTETEDFETVTLPRLVHEKFPWITVEFEMYPDEQYRTTLKSKLASGEGPDMYSWWPKMEMNDIVAANYAKDITGAPFLSNLNESLTDAFTFDGVTYGIPEGMSVLGVYYNKDLFEQVGITELPTNWDEFLAACEKLKALGVAPISMADKDMWYMQFGLYQIAANVVYSEDMEYDKKLVAGERQFNDGTWTKVIEMYDSLYKNGYTTKDTLGIGGAQASQLFVDGQAAMIFDGDFNYDNNMKQGAAGDFERGFFALPANDATYDTMLSAAPAAGYVINADVDEKTYEALGQILEYWFEEGSPLYEAWMKAKGTSSILAHKSYKATNEIFADYNSMLQTNKSIYFCNQAWPDGVADAMESKFQEVITGSAAPKDVTETMETKLRELIEQKGGN